MYFYRESYVTNDSVNKKSDFMKILNWSYKVGCLQCSFSDKELNEFIQLKKREIDLPKRNAVESMGRQNDGMWILGEVCIAPNGEETSKLSCENVWISHIFSGTGIPLLSSACTISLPISTSSLSSLLNTLQKHLSQNFYPTLFFLGASAMALHYVDFIEKLRFCPIPVAFGPSGTGKTTALETALALFGAHKSRLFSKATREKIFDMCCDCAGLPVGVDDPNSYSDIAKLLIYLYNGKKGATVGKGEQQPTSTALIAANFSPSDQARL